MYTYLITGATGYIGSMLAKHILKTDKRADIAALVRDRTKAENILPSGVRLIEAELTDRRQVESINLGCDYIIHCASVTESARMITQPVEVMESIVNTTQNILEFAVKRGIKSMVYLSSMEVYGRIDCSDEHRVSEEELGNIEILNARSCYSLGKRMAENICYSYYKEYGIPVKIARLAQTFGEGVPPSDNRVFVQFARAARQGTDIVLHTKGRSMGNYCGIHDAVRGILTILKKGADGEAYNVVNEENTMSVRDMAELVVERLAGRNIKIRYDIPEENIYGYAPETGLRLSGRKLAELGWEPAESLQKMYSDMMEEGEKEYSDKETN